METHEVGEGQGAKLSTPERLWGHPERKREDARSKTDSDNRSVSKATEGRAGDCRPQRLGHVNLSPLREQGAVRV